MNDVIVLDNPILKSILSDLREKSTKSTDFRRSLRVAGNLMTYEIVGRECSTKERPVTTVFEEMKGETLRERILQIIVMRAGLPFTEGGSRLLDEVESQRDIGVVDARRIEKGGLDMEIEISSFKVPEVKDDSIVIIYDPMVATASTIVEVVSRLEHKERAKKIIVCSILSTPYGIKKLREHFGKELQIYTLTIDTGANDGLDENGYIVPGLGDCGDRAFGTY
ncbi:uracil phosphoribosyltransferase [archaeon]|nr:MAG: uracil phosphoribosyltransferase [archaeon]